MYHCLNNQTVKCFNGIKGRILPLKIFVNNKLTNCLKNIELNKTGKLYFLRSIFGKFELQKYLEFPLSKELRSILTKLRISAHSLAIETGRYNNTLKKQRFCKHCPTSVENESRFILHVYIVPGFTICGLLEIIKKYFPLQGLMPISLRTF